MSAVLAVSEKADARVVPTLLSISKSMRALHGIKLATLGFHIGQDELLMVADEKGTSVSSIADLLSVRPSTVSKMMDRLVDKGLMERIGDGKDARRTLIRITPDGIKARKQVMQAREELEEDLAKSLGDHAPSMAATLEEFASLLQGRLRRLR
jgi:DNA-binding MarR family transcriptional regulator